MTVILIALLLFFVAACVALSFDVVPYAIDIIKRRGMGSFASWEEWESATQNKACEWIEKGIPKVPVVADKRLTVIDRIKGTYSAKSVQSWQEAAILLAVNKNNSSLSSEYISKKLQNGNIFENCKVDFASLAFAMMSNTYTEKSYLKPYMDSMADSLIEKYNRCGSVPYSGNVNQRFVDTIGLVCPFLVKYSLVYSSPEAMETAFALIKEYGEHGLHKELRLPSHCFDASNNAPLGIYGWGRGCGWWAVGLTDCFSLLYKEDGYDKEKTILLKYMLEFADEMEKYQCKNGAFDRSVLSFSGEDSSATAMLAMFFAYLGKLTKREKYITCAEKAMKYILSVTRTDGTVDYSQGDTMGIGFYSGSSIVVPAALGYAVRAYEILKGDAQLD